MTETKDRETFRERQKKCARVYERKKEREIQKEHVCLRKKVYVCMFVCVCVCVCKYDGSEAREY